VQSDRESGMCDLRRRERADGHRDLTGHDGDQSRVGPAIDIELGADRHRTVDPAWTRKVSAIIVRDRERHLPMIDLHQSLGR